MADGTCTTIDLMPLYKALASHFPALNIEGAVAHRDMLLLAQRSNGSHEASAIVVLDLGMALPQLASGQLSATCLRRVVPLQIGLLEGVALAPTDLAVHADGSLWFVAAAEDVDNSYEDGACAGSVLGSLDNEFNVTAMNRIPGALKIEGISGHGEDPRKWLLVADGDNPDIRAPLLCLTLLP